MKKPGDRPRPCPCDSGRAYSACCGLYLDQGAIPQTAESLMRSRYCAYVFKDENYLLRTWHVSTRPRELGLHNEAPVKWLGLKVVATEAGASVNEALVEFVARYALNGKAERLHENSRFILENGHWFYVGAHIFLSRNT